VEVSLRNVVLIVTLYFLQFGLPTLLLLNDMVIGQQVASLLILLGIATAPLVNRTNFRLRRPSDAFPICLLLLIVLVSYFANDHVFSYGTDNWLLYTYIMVPLLAYYLFWVFSVSATDILAAFILMGLISAAIVAADALLQFEVLKPLVRYANVTGTRRVPILKNETVLAFCLLAADLYGRPGWWRRAPWAPVALALLFYVIAFCFESRIAVAAMLMALIVYLAARRIGSMGQFLALVFGLLFGVPALVFALERYIAPILAASDVGSYLRTNNVDIRFQSADYFSEFFAQTHGLGFGLMTLNRDAHNFQSDGIPKSFGVADLGLVGALYQFGWLGLIVVSLATIVLTFRLIGLGRGRAHPSSNRILMVGAYIAGFTLQPIPMNFFTLNWTALLGGTLWYLMRRSRWEANRLAAAPTLPLADAVTRRRERQVAN
jgi:hypothetical protein